MEKTRTRMMQSQELSKPLRPSFMATSKSQGEQPTPRRARTLGPDGEAMLAELAQEVAAIRGKASSRSAVFRALLRLARDFDGALLHRLVGLIEIEGTAGEPEGQDILGH